MLRYAYLIAFIISVLTNLSSAEITIPEGFVVDTLLDQIDGITPRLEVIRNPDYGFGVVAASVDNGILKVFLISQSSVELFGTKSGYPPLSRTLTARFDKTGLFGNQLYISVHYKSANNPNPWEDRTDILRVSSDGNISEVASKGDENDAIGFLFDFTTDEHGYDAGIYLEDQAFAHGTSFYYADSDFNLTKLSQDLLPEGRTDLDIRGMEFDPTNRYGSYLTMADTDINHDDKTVIYQLLPDLSWVELTTPVSTSTRGYRDMCFSNGGTFGQTLYVTDRISETVMSVDPNGVHTEFASGFYKVKSITVSEDGEHMFVSDDNVVYRIRAITTNVGPTIVMREPWAENDDVHTGSSGVDDLRLLWSERVIFENADVNCVGEDGNSVPFSVSGSNSAFMIIAFGEILLHDKYTITISDSVQSAETGAAIDGDNDGTAGGDAIIVIEQRKRSDFNNDNYVDFNDLANFAMNWLWQE